MFGILLIAAALVADIAFVGLGSAFDYPAILQQPPAEVLARFHDNPVVIGGWFLLLAIGAGLLAPVAIGMRTAKWVGVAAAVVQVVGLLRWPLIVPFIDDPDTFHTLNVVLGTIVGESCGYVLTALWTVLVARKMSLLPRVWGFVAAGAIATGLVPALALVNFVGYILWSGWLIGLGVRELTRARVAPASH